MGCDARRSAVLGLGPLWRLRGPLSAAPELAAPEGAEPPVADGPACEGVAAAPRVGEATLDASGLDMDGLAAAVAACRACRLCERRKQAVLGVGDPQADWLFVGEGPGAEEDERGEPFVGQAGRLLDLMLTAIGVRRGERVYIANAVKCRPPNNRTPEPDEIDACFPFLARQIALIRPKLIVALGRPAAQALLKQEIRIGSARGQRFAYDGIPVVVTYHPAYLLRNPADKARVWEDLCRARRLIAEATTPAT